MYKLKQSAVNSEFVDTYVKDMQSGYFYDGVNGERYLVVGGSKCTDDKQAFELNNPFHLYDKYSRLKVKMTPAYTQIIFEQEDPIPF